jgi:hypothetical protein
MSATRTNIEIDVTTQKIESVRKYIPTEEERLDLDNSATHGLLPNGAILPIIERGSHHFLLSDNISYSKKDSLVVWLRLYEIDYTNVNFSTW